MLNWIINISNTWIHLTVCKEMSSGSFKNITYTLFVYKSYIFNICINRTCSYGNDLDMYPATTCDCGRKFNSLRGTRIHKARWCEERNSPAEECKSIDGPMSQVYPHSIHEPIADHQHPGDIFCKPRI